MKGRLPVPDLTAEYRYAGKLGYIELAGLIRYISWEDMNDDSLDLGGYAIGWGLNLSSKVIFSKKITGHFSALMGQGVENYMNDGPIDIGIENNFSDPVKPVKGVPMPVIGAMGFWILIGVKNLPVLLAILFPGSPIQTDRSHRLIKAGNMHWPTFYIIP